MAYIPVVKSNKSKTSSASDYEDDDDEDDNAANKLVKNSTAACDTTTIPDISNYDDATSISIIKKKTGDGYIVSIHDLKDMTDVSALISKTISKPPNKKSKNI